VCPDPNQIKTLIGDDQLLDIISDLLALSDRLGSKSFHIVYDDRHHPCESIMHPNLSTTQGPAILIRMDGPILSSEAIAMLLNTPSQLPSLPDSNSKNSISSNLSLDSEFHDTLVSSSQGSTSKLPGISEPESGYNTYPRSGKRLSSTFALTDCLQILSGNCFYMFDPLGQYLYSGEDGLDQSNSLGTKSKEITEKSQVTDFGKVDPHFPQRKCKAQKCFLTGNSNSASSGDDKQDVISRFPDQFSSFLNLPFNLSEQLTNYNQYRGQSLGSIDVLCASIPCWLLFLDYCLYCLHNLFFSSNSYD
jgi:hypothetical protein